MEGADAHRASDTAAAHAVRWRAKQPAGEDQDQKKRQHEAPH